MRLYVGLDDTDTREAGGTGQLARALARALIEGIPGARLGGVSRHQLLDDPRVPRTRRNRCSCVVLDVPGDAMPAVRVLARDYVRAGSVPGADPGLCVADQARITPMVIAFGRRAQRELLDRELVLRVSARAGLDVEPLGGTGDGVVGALAAVGLRGAGTDGWLTLWAGLRHLDGVMSVDRLLAEGLDRVEDEKGRGLPPTAAVDTRGRVRPALRGGRRVLLVRRVPGGGWEAVKPGQGRLA